MYNMHLVSGNLYFDYKTEKNNSEKGSRVAGTMVARSSSVRVIAHSNLSQLPPLLMYVGK